MRAVAPDQGLADYVSVGFKGEAAALDLGSRATVAQRLQWQLEHGVDLGG